MRVIIFILLLGFTSCKLFQKKKPNNYNLANSNCDEYLKVLSQIENRGHYYFLNHEIDKFLTTFCEQSCLLNKSPIEVKQLLGNPSKVYQMYNYYSNKLMDSCYVYRIAQDDIKYKTKYIISQSTVIVSHSNPKVRRSIVTDTTIISLSKSLLITFIANKCVNTEYISPRQNERIGYFSEPKK